MPSPHCSAGKGESVGKRLDEQGIRSRVMPRDKEVMDFVWVVGVIVT